MSEETLQFSGMTPEQSAALLEHLNEYNERIIAGMSSLAAAFHAMFKPVFDQIQIMFDTPEWQEIFRQLRLARRERLQQRAMYYREMYK